MHRGTQSHYVVQDIDEGDLSVHGGISKKRLNFKSIWFQTTQPTSGGAVTAVLASCCSNCVEPPAPRIGGPIYRFLGKPAIRKCWMAGAAPH